VAPRDHDIDVTRTRLRAAHPATVLTARSPDVDQALMAAVGKAYCPRIVSDGELRRWLDPPQSPLAE
jgi:hypothetical protein